MATPSKGHDKTEASNVWPSESKLRRAVRREMDVKITSEERTAPVQYRTGEGLGRVIAFLQKKHDLSRGEVARRLAILGLRGLSWYWHHDPIVALASTYHDAHRSIGYRAGSFYDTVQEVHQLPHTSIVAARYIREHGLDHNLLTQCQLAMVICNEAECRAQHHGRERAVIKILRDYYDAMHRICLEDEPEHFTPFDKTRIPLEDDQVQIEIREEGEDEEDVDDLGMDGGQST